MGIGVWEEKGGSADHRIYIFVCVCMYIYVYVYIYINIYHIYIWYNLRGKMKINFYYISMPLGCLQGRCKGIYGIYWGGVLRVGTLWRFLL